MSDEPKTEKPAATPESIDPKEVRAQLGLPADAWSRGWRPSGHQLIVPIVTVFDGPMLPFLAPVQLLAV